MQKLCLLIDPMGKGDISLPFSSTSSVLKAKRLEARLRLAASFQERA